MYANTVDPKHRKTFCTLSDTDPIEFFINFIDNFGPGHPVNYCLLNWHEITEKQYNILKEKL